MSAWAINRTNGERLNLEIADRCTLECAFCPKRQNSQRLHDYTCRLDRQPTPDEMIAAMAYR